MRLKKPLVAVVIVLSFFGVGCALITQPMVEELPSKSPHVRPDELERDVRKLAVDLHPRSVYNDANLQSAADYVLTRFRESGAEPAVQEYDAEGTRYRNVIARFGPADGPLTVVGAHYDSNGDTPGADDNASGVAGLIALARLLSAHPPPTPVELVAYPLEEPPYFRTEWMGSMQHARALRDAGREVRFMLSLEMIGYFRDAPGTQDFPMSGLEALYPSEGNFIAIVGRFGDFGTMRRVKALFRGATDLPVVSFNAPRSVPGVDFSDHASYWEFGMRALMITDTAFMRNPNYHALTDTPDTLDYERMAKVVEGVFGVVSAR